MENKEQILKILKLVEDGKLTPEEAEEIITADCDLQILANIRGSIPVFRDRRPELYNI